MIESYYLVSWSRQSVSGMGLFCRHDIHVSLHMGPWIHKVPQSKNREGRTPSSQCWYHFYLFVGVRWRTVWQSSTLPDSHWKCLASRLQHVIPRWELCQGILLWCWWHLPTETGRLKQVRWFSCFFPKIFPILTLQFVSKDSLFLFIKTHLNCTLISEALCALHSYFYMCTCWWNL